MDQQATEQEFEDPLAPARGIINGLLLALPFWIVIGLWVFA